MRTAIVGTDRSRLHGATCRGPCKRPVREGDVVVYWNSPTSSYDEDRVVIYTTCMQAVLDDARTAPPPGHARARAAHIRRKLVETVDISQSVYCTPTSLTLSAFTSSSPARPATSLVSPVPRLSSRWAPTMRPCCRRSASASFTAFASGSDDP